MVNAGQPETRKGIRRGLSLFERVTGTGRARDAKAEAAPQPAPQQPAAQREPAFRPAPQAQATAAPAPQPVAQAPAAPQPQMTMPMMQQPAQAAAPAPRSEPAQPRLGIDPSDKPRGSAMDDDLLDIPAFLRRQAN